MVLAIFQIGLDPTALMAGPIIQDTLPLGSYYSALILGSMYGPLALMFFFYPLAGFVADVCFGRYKVVLCSLKTICITVFVGGFICGLSLLSLILLQDNHSAHIASIVFMGATGGITYLVIFSCYIVFSANVIQFGMDQLMELSNEDSTLFIYWYVWTYFLGLSIARIYWASFSNACNYLVRIYPFLILAGVLALFLLVVLPVSLCCMCSRRVRGWFMVEPGLQNPYKLVWKVLKFAATHDYPIQRSAFTYCEDELPTRIDFGKSKYGGPFETEAIENVKVFGRILFVLLTFSTFFISELAAYVNMPVFGLHLVGDWIESDNCRGVASDFLLGDGVLTPILIVVFIPLYIFLLRPFCYKYVPGMFKRIGLGVVFYLVSLTCTFTTDVIGHTEKNSNATCMFTTDYTEDDYWPTHGQPDILNINSTVLLVQNIFNSLGSLLFYTAAYEFIIAQSPHQMKGLIIGAFFAIKGLSQLMAVGAILVPFYFWSSNLQISRSYPWASCGFAYYLINIFISVFGLVAYTLVARRYQYRQRDEPSNVQQYVENYYNQTQDEPGYDTDLDLDEHDIHTLRHSVMEVPARI